MTWFPKHVLTVPACALCRDTCLSLSGFQASGFGEFLLASRRPEITIKMSTIGIYHAHSLYELRLTFPEDPNHFHKLDTTNTSQDMSPSLQDAEYRNALDKYDKVLTLQRNQAADPLDVATTLSSIGYVRRQKGDYQGAMDVNQESLRIRREIKGDVDEEVASTMTQIALVLLQMDLHDMALGIMMEVYDIRTTLSKAESPDIAFTLYNIALIYHHQGSHEQALSFYRETARVEKATLGESHRDLSITYYHIGQIYYQRGEMELAIESFQDALDIERKCFGENHQTCARTLNEIGNIELQMGNIEGVMQSYTEALRIYREAGESDDHLVIFGCSLWRFEAVQPAAAGAA
jgi:tetratricopeptide (TPR) repeat protein